MTNGLPACWLHSETQTRNEQNQARASLERVCDRLAEWQADDRADADDVMVDETRKLPSEPQLRIAGGRPKWRRFKGTALMPADPAGSDQ